MTIQEQFKKELEKIQWMMDEDNPEEFTPDEIREKAEELKRKVKLQQLVESYKTKPVDDKYTQDPDEKYLTYEEYEEQKAMRAVGSVLGALANTINR